MNVRVSIKVLLVTFMLSVGLTMSVSAPAHAGDFTWGWGGMYSDTNLPGCTNKGWAAWSAGVGPAAWFDGGFCDDGTSINGGWYSRTKTCAELSMTANTNGWCYHANSTSGVTNAHTTAVPAGYNDALSYPQQIKIRRAFRTSSKCGADCNAVDNLTRTQAYDWFVYGIADAPGSPLGFNVFEACAGSSTTSPVAFDYNDSQECVMGAGGTNTEVNMAATSFTGNGSRPHSIAYWLKCGSPTFSTVCVNWSGTYVKYAARYNFREINWTMTDGVSPSVGSLSTNWNQGCWYTSAGDSACGKVGSFTMSGPFYDYNGIRTWGASRNGSGVSGDTYYCDQWDQYGTYRRDRPCWDQTPSYAFPTGGLSQGGNTLSLSAADVVGNSNQYNAAVYIDDSPPTQTPPAPDCTTVSCATLAPCPPGGQAAVQGPQAGYAPDWIKGSVLVGGGACDENSGISSAAIQYQINGGAWATLCALAAAGASVNTQNSCSFNTVGYASGTTVAFRVQATNGAGLTTNSGVSASRRIDNTPPSFSGLHIRALAPSASVKEITNGGNGWTNATSTQAYWTAATDPSGSGVGGYEYSYDPDLEDTGAGSCTAVPATALGVVSSQTLAQNRTDECRQGAHRFTLRVRDNLGNWSASSSRDFSYDSYPTPETRDLAWPCTGKYAPTNCFAPRNLRVTGPSPADTGGWSTTNLFSIAWQNPEYAAPKEAPIQDALIRGPFDWTGPSYTIPASEVQAYAGCTGTAAMCAMTGADAIKIMPEVGGATTLKLWLRDSAGNSDEEMSQSISLNYQDGVCVRP